MMIFISSVGAFLLKHGRIFLKKSKTQKIFSILHVFIWGLIFYSSVDLFLLAIFKAHPTAFFSLLFFALAVLTTHPMIFILSISFGGILFLTVFCLAQTGIQRFIGIQGSYFIAALSIASFFTVFLDADVFENFPTFIWNPLFIFSLAQLIGENEKTHFFFAALIGFGSVGFAYGNYLLKTFSRFGKPLGAARMGNGWDMFRAGFFSEIKSKEPAAATRDYHNRSMHSSLKNTATSKEIEKNVVRGFVLGTSFYGFLRYTSYEPMIFVSGTGGGKSSAIVIPNCFELTADNLVITDIKGEIYAKTASFRKKIGNTIYRFEPGSNTTHRYNPFGLLRAQHLDTDLDMIFKALIPDSHDPIWAEGSRNVAKMMALYFILEENITPTFQMIYITLCDPSLISSTLKMRSVASHPQVQHLLDQYLSLHERMQKDILVNAQAFLSKFDSPQLAHATSANDFDFRDLRKKPMSIYFILPANTETYGAIGAIFFEQMIRLCTEHHTLSPNEYSITAMIDEFANLPKMPSLARGISFLRSYRIRVCAFVQYLAQLRAIYGEDQKQGFMASPLKIAFNVTSYEDAQYFSALAGKKTIRVKNQTVNADYSINVSTHYQHIDLLSPEDIMRLSSKQMLIYRTGFSVVKARKNYWFGNAQYKVFHYTEKW